MRTLVVTTLALGLATSSAAAPAGRASTKTITLDLQDAEVRHVLALLAEVAEKNLVVDDDVKGRITLKLKNVRWDKALAVVLATKGLGAVHDGNIIRVAPRQEIEDEERARLTLAVSCEDAAPLVTRMIPVSYARASELASTVKQTLTKRGTVAVDERTNTLIVRDVDCP